MNERQLLWSMQQVAPLNIVLALVLCVLLSGCDRGPEHVWGIAGEGRVESLSCDNRVFVVLALDRSWESSTAGSRVQSPSASFTGRWRSPDRQREIQWTSRTKDGLIGTLTVDRQSFDLTKGALFLITTDDQSLGVQQLSVDMSQLQGASVSERLRIAATSDSRIAAFLKKYAAR